MHANIAVSCQGLLPMFYGQRVHKSRGLKQLNDGFAVFGLMNFRLLELLPVDEPVDNFMAWQIAERWHVTHVTHGGKVP